jgi:hypothetical protein
MATINGSSGNDVLQAHGGGGDLDIILSGTPAAGIPPNINIWVNNVPVQTNIAVTALHGSATQQIDIPVSGPVTTFAIQYTNDAFTATEDRNVFLSSVTLNGVTLDPALTANYDRTLNGQPFDTIKGQADMIFGGALNFFGPQVQAAGANIAPPNPGPASIDGGAGRDTVVYSGARASFAINHNADGSYTVSGGGVSDTLVNVERLQFSDAKVALDVSGDGGQAYRLYQAAFDRAPDTGGLGFWINSLDNGAALNDVAQGFVTSPEFAAKYAGLDDLGFVNQLYVNVLHRAGEQGGVNFWNGHLAAHDLTRAQVLASFSESPENQAALIGTIQNGVTYA